MPTTLGTPATTLFDYDVEAHKLNLEFVANTAIKAGQAIVLNANEKVDPAAAAADRETIIGYAIMDAAIGANVTVAMRPFAVIYAESGAALNAGPVQLGTYTAGKNRFITTTAVTKTIGFSLDTAVGAGETIRVALI